MVIHLRLRAKRLASGLEHSRPIGRTIVGHDSANPDTEASVKADSTLEEALACKLLLIGKDFHVCKTRAVVDTNVHVLPSRAFDGGAAIAMDSMSYPACKSVPFTSRCSKSPGFWRS